ncbi:MAG: hypothetical protein AB8F94_14315 [Saprospiraceae bacterium]
MSYAQLIQNKFIYNWKENHEKQEAGWGSALLDSMNQRAIEK